MTAAKKTPTPWAAVAGAVRAQLKARRTELGIPAQAVVRVTSESFSGGASVDVLIGGAPDWAWTRSQVDDGPVSVGDKVLTGQARRTGEAIGEIIRVCRDAADVGYLWGAVTYEGTTLESVARVGFVGGQD